MKHCPKCGAACPRPGQKFCAQCGAPLSDMPPQAPAWPPAGAVRRKRLLVGGAAAVAVLLALAGLVWWLNRGGGPAEPADAPATPAPIVTAETAEAASAEMDPTRLYLEGLPVVEGMKITADGVQVPYTVDAQGRPTLDQKDILKGNTLLRAILPQGTGYLTSVALVSRPGNQTASFGALTACDADGLQAPDDEFLQTLLRLYYRSLLTAYNSGKVEDLCFSTDLNDQSWEEAIVGGAYNGVAYAVDRCDIWFTAEGLVRGEDVVTLNAQTSWTGTDRDTGADEHGSEYMTFQIIWRDGMWQVDRWANCTEQDYQNGVLRLSSDRISS